jgi:hypothetical protein
MPGRTSIVRDFRYDLSETKDWLNQVDSTEPTGTKRRIIQVVGARRSNDSITVGASVQEVLARSRIAENASSVNLLLFDSASISARKRFNSTQSGIHLTTFRSTDCRYPIL